MGKSKGGFNLFESYLASGLANQSSTSADNQYIPLPDSMRTSTLLEQIGQERKWSEEQIDHDIEIMENNRLYYVSDLRELSNASWKVIELLPLVKDLLRKALNPPPTNEYDIKKQRKREKKEKKKQKKEKEKSKKMKKLGTPVSNNGYTSVLNDGKPMFTEGVISEDPETIRNTIQNLTVDSSLNNNDEKRSIENANGRKKSVSFSEQDPVSKQPMMMPDDSTSSSSSSSSNSSSSSSDSDCDDKNCVSNTKPVVLNGKSPKVFTGRPIKAVSGNRIRVKTSDGEVFEADRFCPHKKVDLATWGQVLGRSVICTKHNWNFSMDGSMSTKGRTLNPCKVNDW